MNKAKIIADLENMVAARLFGRQPWLADRETYSAVKRKLIQMGLVEQVRDEPLNRKLIQMGLVEVVGDEPLTWQITPLGKELDVDLFEVFMGKNGNVTCQSFWQSMASSTSQSSTPSSNACPTPMRI
jgi:ubiquinone biosynthesis protein UbiJ